MVLEIHVPFLNNFILNQTIMIFQVQFSLTNFIRSWYFDPEKAYIINKPHTDDLKPRNRLYQINL